MDSIIYDLVSECCDPLEAVLAVSEITGTKPEDKIKQVKGTPQTWGWVQNRWKPVHEVVITNIGLNKAQGRFAKIFRGRMVHKSDGSVIWGSGKLFKEYLSNPIVETQETEMALPFLNEIDVLCFLTGKNYANLGVMECLLKSTNGVIYGV